MMKAIMSRSKIGTCAWRKRVVAPPAQCARCSASHWNSDDTVQAVVLATCVDRGQVKLWRTSEGHACRVHTSKYGGGGREALTRKGPHRGLNVVRMAVGRATVDAVESYENGCEGKGFGERAWVQSWLLLKE